MRLFSPLKILKSNLRRFRDRKVRFSDIDAGIESLFHPNRPGMFTAAGGYSHARYQQFTDLSHHVYEQVLGILNQSGLQYFLFAGSMVGYVRNKAMPPWMDDLDIMIFEDQIPLFEEIIIPQLRTAGFNVFRPKKPEYTRGGYHILAMQQGGTRDFSIPLSNNIDVSIPWAQVDVFYSCIDRKGFVRNLSGWGLYHGQDIPVDWVMPGKPIEIDGLWVTAFHDYERDIRKEYGDVLNQVVVATHGKTFLVLDGTPWELVEQKLIRFLRDTSTPYPPGIHRLQLAAFQPDPGRDYTPKAMESYASIVQGVLDSNAGRLNLVYGDHVFWAIDFKRLLPELHIISEPTTREEISRTAHLRQFIDEVRIANQGLAEAYKRAEITLDATKQFCG